MRPEKRDRRRAGVLAVLVILMGLQAFADEQAKRTPEEAAAELARIEAALTPGSATQRPVRATTAPRVTPATPAATAKPAAERAATVATPPAINQSVAAAKTAPAAKATKDSGSTADLSVQEVVRRIEVLMADAAKSRPAAGASAATPPARKAQAPAAAKPKPTPVLAWESPATPAAPGAVLLWEGDIAPIGRAGKRKGVLLTWPEVSGSSFDE